MHMSYEQVTYACLLRKVERCLCQKHSFVGELTMLKEDLRWDTLDFFDIVGNLHFQSIIQNIKWKYCIMKNNSGDFFEFIIYHLSNGYVILIPAVEMQPTIQALHLTFVRPDRIKPLTYTS